VVELRAFTGFFPGFHLQSDNPDDGSAWHAHIVGGDEAKPPVLLIFPAALL
jgi:hypothetical protein